MSWREAAAPVIRKVLEAMKGKPEKEIRAALREAFPWGPRQHHPYKIWLDEIKRQRGLKPQVNDPAERGRQPPDPNQTELALP